jgi:predicted dehydrogenase
MKNLNRRRFLKSTMVATASLSWVSTYGKEKSSGKASPTGLKPIGANGDIRYAVVGLNGRGKNHLDEMSPLPGARLVAICDVDSLVLKREQARLEKSGTKLVAYTDIRKLLENPEIDVVTFATPNHWHALGAIWAIQAGKDVYVEKPVSHNVWEGRQIIRAARQHKRIVQAGTQSRSSQGIAEAISWTREGHLGKLIRARGLCYKRRPSIGLTDQPLEIPSSIDFDLWCGPSPKEPIKRKKLHYDWHWVWPTGNGDLGNQGIHEIDVARWVLGEEKLSPRVLSIGGRLGYEDNGTTPNTLIILHDYKTAPLLYEVRGLPATEGSAKMDQYRGASIGVVVDYEGGTMVIPSYSLARILDQDGKEIKKFEGHSSHYANFLDAVRSRNPKDLRADIQEGHTSSALCHTANISYQLGKTHTPAELREAVKSSHDLSEMLGRMETHLGANKVDLDKSPATLGVSLTMNPETERFTNNAAANQLLTREYRAPFVVPENV